MIYPEVNICINWPNFEIFCKRACGRPTKQWHCNSKLTMSIKTQTITWLCSWSFPSLPNNHCFLGGTAPTEQVVLRELKMNFISSLKKKKKKKKSFLLRTHFKTHYWTLESCVDWFTSVAGSVPLGQPQLTCSLILLLMINQSGNINSSWSKTPGKTSSIQLLHFLPSFLHLDVKHRHLFLCIYWLRTSWICKVRLDFLITTFAFIYFLNFTWKKIKCWSENSEKSNSAHINKIIYYPPFFCQCCVWTLKDKIW